MLGALRRLLRGPVPDPMDRGRFEEDLQRALDFEGSVGRGGTILEAGAGSGHATALLAQRIESPYMVVCFEPEPKAAAALRQRIETEGMQGRVQLFDAAIVGTETMVELQLDTARARNHQVTQASKAGASSATVVGVRFDAHLGRSGLTRVALVVADVGGREPEVLATMATHPLPSPFFVAYRPRALLAAGHDPEEVLRGWAQDNELRWFDEGGAKPVTSEAFNRRVHDEGGAGILGRPRRKGRGSV